jgi:ectoine hydroxylase-related dioxygenase (phytanoyl-CoA dioxygenase family)
MIAEESPYTKRGKPHDPRDQGWLDPVVAQIRDLGFAIVTGVLNPSLIEETRAAMYRTMEAIRQEVGDQRLEQAGELGVLRCMPRFDPLFFRFLEIPEALAIIDATVGPTSILHLQNGFILPSLPELETGTVFQNSFHRDFPRYLGGYTASINVIFAIDAFTQENGGTIVVPGTQQREDRPEDDFMNRCGMPVECPAGSMLVFDSTLWHAAGRNRSGHDRLAINHQFTRSFIKQQIDYVRLLGDAVVEALPPRTQQLLGWYTRVVTSLDEYYRPGAERLYRSGQG